MLCVHCKALDAEVMFVLNNHPHFVCNDKCLKGFLDGKTSTEATRVARRKKAYFNHGRDDMGTPTPVSDVSKGHQRTLWEDD